jgi:hypothetical protein
MRTHVGKLKMKNIVLHLQERQVYQAEWAREQRLASALVTRRVQLSNIVDHKRQLLDSHVILGFSRCGQLLLSYLSELDVTATQSNYTLHWWRFLGNCPLRHVMKEPLFRGEPVPAELHLVVCQTPPPMHTVVVGCRYIHNMHVHVLVLPHPDTIFLLWDIIIGALVQRIFARHATSVYWHFLLSAPHHLLTTTPYTSSLT